MISIAIAYTYTHCKIQLTKDREKPASKLSSIVEILMPWQMDGCVAWFEGNHSYRMCKQKCTSTKKKIARNEAHNFFGFDTFCKHMKKMGTNEQNRENQSYAPFYFIRTRSHLMMLEVFFVQSTNTFLRFSFSFIWKFRYFASLFIYLSQIWICMTHSVKFPLLAFSLFSRSFIITADNNNNYIFLSSFKMEWPHSIFLSLFRVFTHLFVWLIGWFYSFHGALMIFFLVPWPFNDHRILPPQNKRGKKNTSRDC